MRTLENCLKWPISMLEQVVGGPERTAAWSTVDRACASRHDLVIEDLAR